MGLVHGVHCAARYLFSTCEAHVYTTWALLFPYTLSRNLSVSNPKPHHYAQFQVLPNTCPKSPCPFSLPVSWPLISCSPTPQPPGWCPRQGLASLLGFRYSAVAMTPELLILSVWTPAQFSSFFILSPAQCFLPLLLATLKHHAHPQDTGIRSLLASAKNVYLIFSFTGASPLCLSSNAASSGKTF